MASAPSPVAGPPALVELSALRLEDVFASFYTTYANRPFGSVEVRNRGSDPVDVLLRFSLPDLMRQPAEQVVRLHRGVYAAMLGPSYESAAEVNMLRLAGADAVGMSTAPEIIAARHAGMRVAAVATITNSLVHPDAPPPTHEEVLANAERAAADLARLIRGVVPQWTASGQPRSA